MANYQKNADSALKTIAKAGGKLEIFRPVLNFNDVTGVPLNDVTQRGFITAVVLPRYKGQIFGSLDDSLKEALVKGKLRTVLAAAKGAPFEPGPLDIIKINGVDWQVIGCTPLAPDGVTNIIFTIGVVETGTFTPSDSADA